MKKLILICILLSCFTITKSQSSGGSAIYGEYTLPVATYTYDNCGNRIKREIIIVTFNDPACMSTYKNDTTNKDSINKVSSFARKNNLNNNANYDSTTHESKLGNQKITVFPNPTLGQLNVTITPIQSNLQSRLFVFDLQGKVLYNKENLTESNSIDITSLPSGN